MSPENKRIRHALISEQRTLFLAQLLESAALTSDSSGIPNIADRGSKVSVAIASRMLALIGEVTTAAKGSGQTAGKNFEAAIAAFLRATFISLEHLRPGDWIVCEQSNGGALEISNFEQYSHLLQLRQIIESNPQVAAALGADYLITPDVIVARKLESDERINQPRSIVDSETARLTPLRSINREPQRVTVRGSVIDQEPLLLHASVSCKWTLRSDRAQNARSEALNLIRNRKGRVPHIVAVTAEPLPSRIASLALGTSDLDCVYHIALPELLKAVEDVTGESTSDQFAGLTTLIEGKRLRDIADLPLDLVI